MEKPPVLTYQQCREATMPMRPPLTDWERIAERQRDDTLRWVVEQGNKVCQHHLIRRQCYDCWQELQKLAGIK